MTQNQSLFLSPLHSTQHKNLYPAATQHPNARGRARSSALPAARPANGYYGPTSSRVPAAIPIPILPLPGAAGSPTSAAPRRAADGVRPRKHPTPLQPPRARAAQLKAHRAARARTLSARSGDLRSGPPREQQRGRPPSPAGRPGGARARARRRPPPLMPARCGLRARGEARARWLPPADESLYKTGKDKKVYVSAH